VPLLCFLQVKKAGREGGLHLDWGDNVVVVGGLAVVQQIRFRQGRKGALALFSPGKEGYLGRGGGFTWTVLTMWWSGVWLWRSRSTLGKVR
jgi:hypothetical protein